MDEEFLHNRVLSVNWLFASDRSSLLDGVRNVFLTERLDHTRKKKNGAIPMPFSHTLYDDKTFTFNVSTAK